MAYFNGNNDFTVILHRGGGNGNVPLLRVEEENVMVSYDGGNVWELLCTLPNGSDGVSISEIEKIATEGFVDTYKITLTNGKTSNFTTDGLDTSKLGDAKPSDVRAGRTFTSAEGVKIEGTNTYGGGGDDLCTGTVFVVLGDVTSGYVEAWYTIFNDESGLIERKHFTVDAGGTLGLDGVVTGSIIVLKFPNYVQLYDDTTNVIANEWSGENGGTVMYCFEVVAAQDNRQYIRFWS